MLFNTPLSRYLKDTALKVDIHVLNGICVLNRPVATKYFLKSTNWKDFLKYNTFTLDIEKNWAAAYFLLLH